MNEMDANDEAIRGIMANSKLEISTKGFASVVMEKVWLAEKRKRQQQKIFSWMVLFLGALIFIAAAAVFITQTNTSHLLQPLISTGAAIGHTLQKGNWVNTYVHIAQVLIAMFVVKIIMEWQMEAG